MLDTKIIIKYFCQQISKILGYPSAYPDLLKKSKRVTITAIYYFRKFYNVNTLQNHDPRLILLSCIFLAGKVEHDFIHMKNLLEVYNSRFTEEMVVESEILVLQSIKFELKVFHAQSCLFSIIADIKQQASCAVVSDVGREPLYSSPTVAINEWLKRTEDIIFTLQLTEAIFIPAPTLAICSLLIADPPTILSMLNCDFNQYLQDKLQHLVDISALVDTHKSKLHEIYMESKVLIEMNYLQEQMIILKSLQVWKQPNS